MSNYDFDEVIERKNTNSLKYDCAVQRGKPADILPLWVADMDFRAPDEVIEALVKKAEHGIFGYSEPMEEYYDAIEKWFPAHYGWKPDRSRFVQSCGVVFALCNLVQALTQPGDAVLITQPVYYPFSEAITDNHRRLVNSSLVYRNGRYEIDFEDFETKIVHNRVKLFLLCSPHNPVGRVWSRQELETIAEICLKHDVFVIADEIHADFVFRGHEFVSFASLGDEALDKAVICTSPSKTFNLAGLHNANIYIHNDGVRAAYRCALNRTGYSQSNVFGLTACQAAYTYGEEWLRELLEYLEGNLSFVREYLREKIPQIELVEPEGTYLLWLDCRKLGLTDGELNDLIVNQAGLWLDAGNIFGEDGRQFERMNIATTRSTLKKAFEQLREALKAEGLI